MNNKKAAKFFKEARMKQKISVITLAKKLGLESVSVYKYEACDMLPSMEILARYCFHLKLNSSEVLDILYRENK